MGRAYAGILGPLAFALVIARGVAAGSSIEAVPSASIALFAFSALGYIAGQTADLLVRDSVRSQFEAAMHQWKQKSEQSPTKQ